MKKPRIADFDPEAARHSLKSSLEDMPAIIRPERNLTTSPSVERKAEAPDGSASGSSSRSPAQDVRIAPTVPRQEPPRVSPTAKAKRAFVRRTFDFYEDQISYLMRVSLEAKLAGNERSMNEMVREAIEDWIRKHIKKQ